MKRLNGVTNAILTLRPGAQFIVRDDDYSKIEWHSDNISMPTEQEVIAAIAELEANEPKRLLREIRDWYLQNSDWTQGHDIRQIRGPEWCAAWDAYRQALRDMPATQNPYFANPQDMHISGVTWPEQPPAN